MQKESALLNQAHWEKQYDEGVLPWDSGITPPEVVAFWRSTFLKDEDRVGKFAVDLGCGTGTNVTYLASLGLHTIGIELAGNGLAVAQERLRQHTAPMQANTLVSSETNVGQEKMGSQPDVARRDILLSRVALIQASATALPISNVDPIYMLDIGCFHTIHPDLRAAYAQDVCTLLAPGGYFHLYGFDWMEACANDPQKTPRGFHENEVAELFAPALDVVEIQRATASPHPCRWYLLQKREAHSHLP